MAVSRESKSVDSNNSVPGAPNRVSFAKLREPLEVPGLLDVQTDSFEWLIGSDRWRSKAVDRGDINPVGGLEEVLAELSPGRHRLRSAPHREAAARSRAGTSLGCSASRDMR